jgi:dolichol-phosphate mannosyltransferase
MNSKPYFSVVIPVYRCEKCLVELYKRLKQTLEKLNKEFEIIFINDASPDNAWQVITELGKKDKRVTGICLSRNFGQHYAITAGLEIVSG